MDFPLGRLRSLAKRPVVSRRAIMTAMVLSIVFAIAVLVRSYAAKYGFYLNEFDPYYDYYAASHIVTLAQQHGLYFALFNDNTATCTAAVLDPACHAQTGYFFWHDVTTWFPTGRNVAATSQGGLQLAGAVIFLVAHNIFGIPISLYDTLVLLPVFFGAVTAVLFYFLVRKVAGDAAGLFSALIFAVSPPLIERGNLGWFKSEPLSIMLFVAASYVMLTVFDKGRASRSKLLRAVFAGLLVGYANAAWGGGDFFSASFGVFFLLLPFTSVDLSELTPAIVSFTASTILVSAAFPRPGVAIVTNPVGLALAGGTVFVIVAQWAKTWTKPAEYRRMLAKLLLGFGVGGLALISFGVVGGLSGRYIAAIAPWARSDNALIQSVAEHFVPTGGDYFTAYASLLSFGIAGALVAFRRKGIPMMYALVFGLAGLYFSASFSRLLVYSSIALGLLAGIGFAELAFAIVKPSATPLVKKKQVVTSRNEMKVVFSVALIALIAFPAGTYWIPNPIQCSASNVLFCDQSPADSAVSLANGATAYSRVSSSDWIQTLHWVSTSTPASSVIISWWDYGYWFAVMGNRSSTVDNATLNGTRIAQVGQLLMSNATQANKIAKQMTDGRPTYVAIFLVGSIITLSSSSTGGSSQQYYVLQVPSGGGFTAGGGDESKKQWFIRIGGLNESQFLECPSIDTPGCSTIDDFNLTPFAMNNTLFANMFPFTSAGFLVSGTSNGQPTVNVVKTYQTSSNGAPPIQVFNYPAKYTFGTNSTSLFRLAYASPSLAAAAAGNSPCPGNSQMQCFNAILVYQVL